MTHPSMILERTTCDTCRKRSTGTMHYHNGTPVLFECGVCNPRSYWYAFKAAIVAIFTGR